MPSCIFHVYVTIVAAMSLVGLKNDVLLVACLAWVPRIIDYSSENGISFWGVEEIFFTTLAGAEEKQKIR